MSTFARIVAGNDQVGLTNGDFANASSAKLTWRLAGGEALIDGTLDFGFTRSADSLAGMSF